MVAERVVVSVYGVVVANERVVGSEVTVVREVTVIQIAVAEIVPRETSRYYMAEVMPCNAVAGKAVHTTSTNAADMDAARANAAKMDAAAMTAAEMHSAVATTTEMHSATMATTTSMTTTATATGQGSAAVCNQ